MEAYDSLSHAYPRREHWLEANVRRRVSVPHRPDIGEQRELQQLRQKQRAHPIIDVGDEQRVASDRNDPARTS